MVTPYVKHQNATNPVLFIIDKKTDGVANNRESNFSNGIMAQFALARLKVRRNKLDIKIDKDLH